MLRTGHAHGLPIRQGGRPVVSATVELIAGLYDDAETAAVLDRGRVPRRRGWRHRRALPEPVPLTRDRGRATFYTKAGCSTPQIEPLSGESQVVVRARMHQWGIPRRDEHLSPALLPAPGSRSQASGRQAATGSASIAPSS